MEFIKPFIVTKHASELAAMVADRQTAYPEEWYKGCRIEDVGALIADFKEAFKAVRMQSMERSVVSIACMATMVYGVAKDITMKTDELFNVKPVRGKIWKWFILNVLTPFVDECPFNDVTLNSFLKNADYLIIAEQRIPWMIPCSVESIGVGGFTDLSTEDKFKVIAHISDKVITLRSVRTAYGKFQKYGPAAVKFDEPGTLTPPMGYDDIILTDGRLAVEVRTSDKYVNMTVLSSYVNGRPLWSEYAKIQANVRFMQGLSDKMVRNGDIRPVYYKTSSPHNSIWANMKVAVHAAEWRGLTELVDRLKADYPDDVKPSCCESDNDASDRPDTFMVEEISGDGWSTERRSYDNFCDCTKLMRSLGTAVMSNKMQCAPFREAIEAIARSIGLATTEVRDTGRSGMCLYDWVHPEVGAFVVKTTNPRAVDSFKAAYAQPFRASAEVYTCARDEDGMLITVIRKSDNLCDIRKVSEWITDTTCEQPSKYRDFCKSAAVKNSCENRDIITTSGIFNGSWVSLSIASEYAASNGIKHVYPMLMSAVANACTGAQGYEFAVRSDDCFDGIGSFVQDQSVHGDIVVTGSSNAILLTTPGVGSRKIRTTTECPVFASTLDLIDNATNTIGHANDVWEMILKTHGNVIDASPNFRVKRFPGRGQKLTPAVDARGAVMVLNTLPGKAASHFRRSHAALVVEFMGGGDDLKADINRGEACVAPLPDDACPAQVFTGHRNGKLVEVVRLTQVSPSSSACQRIFLPDLALPASGIYIGYIGTCASTGRHFWKIGISDNIPRRLNQHIAAFDIFILAYLCLTGHKYPSQIETTLGELLRDCKVDFEVKNKIQRECYATPIAEGDSILDAVNDHVMDNNLSDVTSMHMRRRDVVMDARPALMAGSDALLVEQERTKQAVARQKEAEARLELMKIRLRMSRRKIILRR